MKKINTVVSCVNDASMVVKNCVKTSVAKKAKTFESELMLLEVNKITDLIPNKVIDVDVNVSMFVPLADDKFNIPDRIDMLLGAEIFYELLKPGKFYCDNSHLVLQNTVFGYVVSGIVDQVTEIRVHCGLIVDDDLNKTLKKFWETEGVHIEPTVDTEKLGHLERVVESNEPPTHYYIPHHGVLRPEKLTIKLRIVFNGSSPTTTGISLNDILLKGEVKEDVFESKVLSVIAKLYDPLGFLGPVIAKAKVFLQQLWQCKLDWDDVLPNSIANEWREFVTTLKCTEEVKINRFIMADNNVRIVLQGFADASEAAYGAVVYLQCFLHNGAAKVSILASKSRVAPIPVISIPRLELCACVLLAQLVKKIHSNLSDGLLRVGGRLSNSDLPYVNKHPAILPGNYNLTVQIIAHFHRKNLHTGASSLLHYVRETFWPLNGRSVCRKVVHECLVCFKSQPLVTSQLMGNLPRDTVVPDYPFNCSSVDFCGPFMIRYKNQRKGILHKIYICVFVCFVSKAIHIEIVSDLTSDAFIATLKRFFSRRGKCVKLYSDNGKTFVGANKELKRFQKLIEDSDDNLAGFLSAEGIEWKFIPPRAPSFGGLWEASVKSIKYHLRRVVSGSNLTYEEFLTVCIQIEGILNFRPLCVTFIEQFG
ncbi:integrase catalytic domain-containing protein [Trichonephila clavipes]|nr:integrase catalytic domain-containing protein [Trichonephila clavipes]